MIESAIQGGVRQNLANEVLVTGASGFLGRHLVAALAAAGRQVTGLSRRPPAREELQAAADRLLHHHTATPETGAAVRWVHGDVRRPESYLQHVRPGIAVYHLAALRSHAGRRRGDVEAVNVTACRDLARTCLERGAGRFVLVTTAHLYGPSADGKARREDDGPAVCRHEAMAGTGGEPALGWYERSRGLALLEVRRLVGEGLNAVALCPTILFGPDRRSHPNRITDELRRIVNGRPPVVMLIDGGTAGRDLAYVDDIVDAALAAERLAPVGAEVLLGGEAISHRELIGRTLALAGRRPSRLTLSIPGPAALAAASAADRLLGNDPGCGHAAAVARAMHEWRFDSERARQMLGYRPRPLDEGLAATLRWMRAKGGAS